MIGKQTAFRIVLYYTLRSARIDTPLLVERVRVRKVRKAPHSTRTISFLFKPIVPFFCCFVHVSPPPSKPLQSLRLLVAGPLSSKGGFHGRTVPSVNELEGIFHHLIPSLCRSLSLFLDRSRGHGRRTQSLLRLIINTSMVSNNSLPLPRFE